MDSGEQMLAFAQRSAISMHHSSLTLFLPICLFYTGTHTACMEKSQTSSGFEFDSLSPSLCRFVAEAPNIPTYLPVCTPSIAPGSIGTVWVGRSGKGYQKINDHLMTEERGKGALLGQQQQQHGKVKLLQRVALTSCAKTWNTAPEDGDDDSTRIN